MTIRSMLKASMLQEAKQRAERAGTVWGTYG